MELPLREVSVHQRHETLVVMPRDQMNEFVDDDVFEALHRLLGEFKVQPDAVGLGIASAPSRFHFLDAPLSDHNTQDRLPFLDERWNQFFELLAIPTLQDYFPLRFALPRSNMQLDDSASHR